MISSSELTAATFGGLAPSQGAATRTGRVIRCPSSATPVVPATVAHAITTIEQRSLARPVAALTADGDAHGVQLAHTDGVVDAGVITDEEPLDLEAMAATAWRAGFEEGLSQGHAEASASIEAARADAVAALCTGLQTAANEAATMRQSALDELVADAADLAVTLATTLVHHELSLGAAPVRDAIVRALQLLGDEPDLVVRVHPDCGLTDTEVATLTSHVSNGTSVQVIRDETVDVGGCVVRAGSCHIDAQLPTALERVRAAIAEMFGSSSPGPTDTDGQHAELNPRPTAPEHEVGR